MLKQIDQLYNPLFLYVRKRVRNEEDAKDLTQDIFYKLSKSESSEILSTKSWVYTIAKNTITDYYRKKSLLTDDIEDEGFLEEFKGVDAVEELGKCSASFVNQLPEDYKVIMKLSELEEISQKDIASQLNLKYSTVRSKVQRGRLKLRDLFSECCDIIQGGQGSIMDYKPKNACDNKDACS